MNPMICGICMDNVFLFYSRCDCECKIYYHESCISHWYEIRADCPVCRKHQDPTNKITLSRVPLLSFVCLLYILYISLWLVESYRRNVLFTYHIFGIVFRASLIPIGMTMVHYLHKEYRKLFYGAIFVMINACVIYVDNKKVDVGYDYLKMLVFLNISSFWILWALASAYYEDFLGFPVGKICCLCDKKIHLFYLKPSCYHEGAYYHHSCRPQWFDTGKICPFPMCNKVDNRLYITMSSCLYFILFFNVSLLFYIAYKEYPKSVNYMTIGKIFLLIDGISFVMFVMIMIVQSYINTKIVHVNNILFKTH